MNPTPGGADPNGEELPQIPEHILIRRIGKGAYGHVWLAKNVLGGFRAAKLVYRRFFEDERPYQREFEGVQKFDPISRLHKGLVHILQVGKNEEAGYFYYVMELADDVRTTQTIETDTYTARTLKWEIANHPHRPIETSLQIALSLTSPLEYLHSQGLVHRDIKPSNIIFVNGVPKLADVGLITKAGKDVSHVGTRYYMPNEKPGEPTADIFGLGKVFYELFMGLPVERFPDPPDEAKDFTPELRRINNIIAKACHPDAKHRFQTAKELHKALQARVRWTRRDALIGLGGAVAGGAMLLAIRTSNSAQSGPSSAEPLTNSTQSTNTTVASGGQVPNLEASRNEPVVVLMDTTADGGIYDKNNIGNGGSNAKEVRKALEEMHLSPPLRLIVEQIDLDWRRQSHVREWHPDLIIIHRSSFFHPVNYFLKFKRPFDEETEMKWAAVYRLADDKLIDFMAYIGSHLQQTRFLVYSRGTDPGWPKDEYRNKWVESIERAYPELEDRITTMVVPGGIENGSFRNTDAREVLRTNVVDILK
jgi:serine/threonine protein kinase